MQYEEDDMLMLSGIQHYAFCPRQWALIHIDQQWEENRLTIEGQIMHQHVDDPFYRQKMGDVICLRSVSIASKNLGLYGLSDVIELHPTDSPTNSITHPSYSGYWIPYPIEYKHGKPKRDHIDIVQLTASLALDMIEELRAYMGDRFVLSLINRKQITKHDFLYQGEKGVLLTDNGRKTFITAWQARKKDVITHPFLQEKIPVGLIPYAQAQLMARCIRGDLDAYPVFLIK